MFDSDDDDSEEDLKFKPTKKKEEAKAAVKP